MHALDQAENVPDWFDLAPVPLVAFTLDTLRVAHVNPAICELYGYTKDDAIGRSIMDFIEPTEQARLAFLAGQVVEGAVTGVTTRHITRSGEVIDVEIKTRVVDFGARKLKLSSIHPITHLMATQTKVAEQMARANRILRQAEASFRRAELLIAADNDLILVVDPDDLQVRWTNTRFLAAIGLGREMVNGARLGDVMRSSSKTGAVGVDVEDLVRKALAEGKRAVIDGLPEGLSHLAGSDAMPGNNWTTLALPLTDPRNQTTILILIIRPWADTTARVSDADLVFEVANKLRMGLRVEPASDRLAQTELAQAQLRLRVVRELLGYADWQLDIESGLVTWSEEIYATLGIARSERQMTFDAYLERVHEDDRIAVSTGFAAFLTSDQSRLQLRHRVRRPDCTVVYIKGECERVRINGRDTLLGVARDATGEHEAQASVQRQSDLARLAGKIAQIGGWYLDAGTRVMDWSDEAGRIHGLPETRRISLSLVLGMFRPEHRDRIATKFDRCLSHGEPFDEVLDLQPGRRPVFPVRILGAAERDLKGRIVGVSGAIQDVSTPTQQRREMAVLSDRLHATLEAMSDGFISLDPDCRVEYMNLSVETSFDCKREELLGRTIWSILADLGAEEGQADLRRALDKRASETFDCFVPVLDKVLRVTTQARRNGFDLLIRDVTEDQKHQRLLLQSQKLEALGQLTGGIAHDFNNLLTVILGNTDILLEELKDPRHRKLAQIAATTADRGAQLTSRLLSFARRQTLTPRVVLAEDVIEGMVPLLTRALGESATLEVRLDCEPTPIEIDPHQLETALLNLSLNGRDAMPEGGRIVLTVERGEMERDGQRKPAVAISVTDSGAGMDEKTLSRVFEPFFTTKPEGKGTGLGLPMVYGFATQSGGEVKISSTPGEGTTVQLLFPALSRPAMAKSDDEVMTDLPRGNSEHILVVEDEPFVRDFVSAQLKALGYKVSSAANAEAALRMLKRHSTIQLLFTDIILANSRNGRELADQARALRPGLKVLYTSGYAADVLSSTGRLGPDVMLLAKPYQRSTMAQKVSEALAR